MRGRPNPLSDPDFAQQVAEAVAAGCSRETMCEMFGIKDVQTITRWKKDPRVKLIARKLMEDRVLEVTRKLDAVIAGRLQHADKLSMKDLLAIRKEFLGGQMREQTQKADEDQIMALQDLFEENPDAADQLEELLKTGKLADASE